jgi:hypothetical protein
MPKRANYIMVPEDDTQWLRFWNAYEKRSSKKDARKAWAELNPSPALVDTICTALAWQFQQPDWCKANRAYAPLPATYLRGERWTDEPPTAGPMRPMSAAVADPFKAWLENKAVGS